MKARDRKKLAMLVAMALSVTVGVGMNPMDAYAAVNVTYSEGKYTVTDERGTGYYIPTDHLTTVVAEINSALSADTDKEQRIYITNLGDGGALLTQLQKSTLTLKQGVTYELTDTNGTYTVVTGDSAGATVTATAAKTFSISGEGAKVTVPDGAKVTVTTTTGSTNTVNVEKGASASVIVDGMSTGEGTITLSGDGKVTSLTVNKSTTVTGTTSDTAVSVESGMTLTTAGDAAVASITGAGSVTLAEDSTLTSAGKIDSTGGFSVAESGNANIIAEGQDINLGKTGTINLGTGAITAENIRAASVTAGEINATKLTLNALYDLNSSDTTYNVDTLEVIHGDLTVTNASNLNAGTIKVVNGEFTMSDAANALTATSITASDGVTITSGSAKNLESITSTGGRVYIDATKVNSGINITANTSGKGLTVSGGDLTAGTIDVGTLDAGGQAVTADSISVNGTVANLKSDTGLTADSVTLGAATTFSEGAVINTDTLTIDNGITATDLATELKVNSKSGGTVRVKVNTTGGAKIDETLKAFLDDVNNENVTIVAYDTEAAQSASEAKAAAEKVTTALKSNVNEFAGQDADTIAKADPFLVKLPSSTDVAEIASVTDESLAEALAASGTADQLKTELSSAINALDEKIKVLSGDDYADQIADLTAQKNEYQALYDSLDAAGMQAQAAKLTAATKQAGKTAAAPGISSARAAAIINDVMTGNVIDRISELREVAAAVEDGRPAPDNVWFQYKHTNTEVGSGDVYNESTVKTNNYQLGYDKKIGENDYLGAYIGTTTGSVEFNGPARSGDADIDSSYQVGIYGTHMLPKDQYIDYMIHTGKFDTKYNGETWGTKDTGAMVGYGAKIAANDRLTWNPYIRLAYDKVSVDSYLAGVNKVSSDDSNNWTAKIGINLMDASGFYGGLAYSRGLSGSYNAYINGIAMPTEDFNANVIYLSLGYRANLSKKVFLDLSAEKTFADYKGWTAAGKVNFYF